MSGYPLISSATDGSYNLSEYRENKPVSEYTYPTKKGYVFAGWYEESTYDTPISDTKKTGTAYAKFVDENVLSVKCQLTAGTYIASDSTSFRMLTTVDSLEYDAVGFVIEVNGKSVYKESKTVYTSVLAYVDGKHNVCKPTVFSANSKYFATCLMTNINSSRFDTSIKVTPTWTTLDGTIVKGLEKTYTVNELVGNVTLEDSFEVGLYDDGCDNSGSTFEIDLGMWAYLVADGTTTSVTVADETATSVAFAVSNYADGILTLDVPTLSTVGKKIVTAIFTVTGVDTPVTVTAELQTYTMILNDELELNRFRTVLAAYPDGLYVLGNDIICTDYFTYNNERTTLSGTFDGRGYAIHNFKTKGETGNRRGLIGHQLTGTLKNLSFVNATHAGECSMIAYSIEEGTIENVYASVNITPAGDVGGVEGTSVLGSNMNAKTRINKVFIEYLTPLPSTASDGYAIHEMTLGYGCINGLVVVGAERAYSYVSSEGTKLDDYYGAFMTYADLRIGKDVRSWATAEESRDFWTVTDRVPYPKNLKIRQTAEKGTLDAEIYKDTFEVSLTDTKYLVTGAELVSVTLKDTPFQTVAYKNGTLTLDSATLGGIGQKTVVATFVRNNLSIRVTLNMYAYTMVINNEAELNQFKSVLVSNPDGHYVLGNDIVCSGVFNHDNYAKPDMSGTFDGRGYSIKNFTTAASTNSTANDPYRNLFGKTFTGTLKNISFVNATHTGYGSMIARYMNGTMENVYVSVNLTPDSSTTFSNEVGSSVLGTKTNANSTFKNVYVEYLTPLPSTAVNGYAVNDLCLKYGKIKGLYVVGASKVYGSSRSSGTSAATDEMGAYADAEAFQAAGLDFSTWDTTFWMLTDGMPEPRRVEEHIITAATTEDMSVLNAIYGNRLLYQGELHDHARIQTSPQGYDDGGQYLSKWKSDLETLDMDFATILNHKQVRHMTNADWDSTVFIGGSEAATYITDGLIGTVESNSLHYNMIFSDRDVLAGLLKEFTEFEFDDERHLSFSWDSGVFYDYSRTDSGDAAQFIYPSFSKSRFIELATAIREKGGFLVIPHTKQEMKSDNALDYWFAADDVVWGNYGMEVIYWKNGLNSAMTEANYDLWAELLALGKRVWACAGYDGHDLASSDTLTSIFSEEKSAAAYIQHLRNGDFTAGSVGIKMCMGDTQMGGSCNFADKKLVIGVDGFHRSVFESDHIYRMDVINETGVVCSREIYGDVSTYVTVEAENCDFYRVEIYDVTKDWRIAIGNPIWNDGNN